MSTEVATTDGNLPAVQDDTDLVAKLGGKTYIGYLVIHATNGKFVGPPHKLPAGHILMVEDQEPTDLGESIDVYILDHRFLAMKYGSDVNDRVYDDENELFLEYQAKADAKVEEENGDRYYWGVEYLLYDYGTEKFTTLFCNNPTLRRAAKKKIQKLMRKNATITMDWIDPDKSPHAWWGIEVTECSVDHPDIDEVAATEQINKFRNPEVEEAVEEPEEDR